MPLRDSGGIRSADNAYAIDEFVALPNSEKYWCLRTCSWWSAQPIDASFPKVSVGRSNAKLVQVKPSTWLLRHRRVEQMVWAPGEPLFVEGKLLIKGAWKEQPGALAVNIYEPPTLVPGDAALAKPWIDHVHVLYPEEAGHIIDWCAHRLQRPGEKVNHAIVLGGGPGIGKDAILEVLRPCVGPANYQEIAPANLVDTFNPFLETVILRISEAHDTGEGGKLDRFKLHERTKTLLTTPPDAAAVNDKFVPRRYVMNVCGVAFTTNHKTDGLYLPENDRRHFMTWSECKAADFPKDYWDRYWQWARGDGPRHLAAFLRQRDISGFDPKAPPRHTEAFDAVVGANAAPETAELADALDELGRPEACTLVQIAGTGRGKGLEWLTDRKYARHVFHRLSAVGYGACPGPSDGRWKINGRRCTIFVRVGLGQEKQQVAARSLVLQLSKTKGEG